MVIYSQIKPSVLQNLPVSKYFSDEIVSQIEFKTQEIVELYKSKNIDSTEIIIEINQLVYQLYELTSEEIAIIEESVK